jgi:hypothetical protein
MQLNLAFLDQPDPSPRPSATAPPVTAAWEQLDEATRIAALEILARLIARMVAPDPAKEASDE